LFLSACTEFENTFGHRVDAPDHSRFAADEKGLIADEAARILHIGRDALRYKMRNHGGPSA
jgi:hypothetical protein